MNKFLVQTLPLALMASALVSAPAMAADRAVNVYFKANVDVGVPLDFGPVAPAVRVKVGQRGSMMYRFTNFSDKPLEIQAVHQIKPASAEAAFDKIQCFCFTRQTLKPHETRMMPVEFKVEPSLSPNVPEITLGYTIYKVHAIK